MMRDHGFHKIRITQVIQETADTRTYALGAPFPYRAGQFVTFRIRGTLRSYSMSSCPDTDNELLTTVKRVPGGVVSNWMHDNLAVGEIRVNNALDDDELADGWVLTCQSEPVTPNVTVRYDD
jgi:3-ketosteroid 9alpha-monooxygenase subunit B